MTITLLAPDGVSVTAQQERQARAAQHGGGAGRPLGGRSGFRVDTPASVFTATSTTWTLGPCSAEIDPGASVHQGMYGWASDANIQGSITPADQTNARKDIVYIQINDSTAGDGSGEVTYAPKYLAGPMDGTNKAPALPARSFLVGTIDVPKVGAGSPTATLNPAKYVAAGSPQPATLAERDALTKYDGLSVRRTDLPNRPVETWDGTAWTREGSLIQIGQGDKVPIFKSTEVAVALDSFSVGYISFPSAFPNALVSTTLMRNHNTGAPTSFNLVSPGTDKNGIKFVTSNGANSTVYIQYQCWGY